jgi:hypothetical protein
MAHRSECRAAGIGAAVFTAIQLALIPFSVGGVGWFLDSGTTIVITLAVLSAAAILIELVDRGFLPWRPVWMTAGVWTAMIVYLFTIGPGNLFPSLSRWRRSCWFRPSWSRRTWEWCGSFFGGTRGERLVAFSFGSFRRRSRARSVRADARGGQPRPSPGRGPHDPRLPSRAAKQHLAARC